MQAVEQPSHAEVPRSGVDPVLSTGDVIAGRYRLDEIIGQGGMATVWRGHDERLGRDVAIKVCPPTDAVMPLPVREERLSSTLLHPNVVSIFDAGDIADGEPGAGSAFIVMEFVSGTTAHQLAPVGWREAVRIVRQAADGLAAAHERGIVHCDVKPGNLLIDQRGRVLVADFGIAMPSESEIGEFVHGSPAYLAPERLVGAPADPRADVYGLGGVLAFLITGHRPAEDLVSLPLNCPSQIARVIERSRAPNPLERYADAREFQAALDRAAGTEVNRRDVDTVITERSSHSQPRATAATSRRVISHPMRVQPTPARQRAQQTAAMSPSPMQIARPGTSTRSRPPAYRPASRRHRGTVFVACIAGLLLLLLAGLVLRQIISIETVSSPPAAAAIDMPNVQGVTFVAAIESLSERGLIVERVDVIYGPGPINQVVAQNPAPGATIDDDDPVTLVVRTGL